jgi:simple sugar transport system permease protein
MTQIKKFFPYLLAVLTAFLVVGILLWALKFNPLKAYQTLLFTSFRTPNGFIQTLLKWIPLTLCALAFTVPLSSGKFNIGAEGQMLVGAIGAAAVGIIFKDLPAALLLPLVILAGILAGAFWGLIAAWLLYQFNINEILSTVLLNFISFALIDFVATGPWRDPAAGHPTTVPIGTGGFLPMLVKNPPLHSGLIIAVIVAAAVYFFTSKTTSGYELVVTGANPRASKVHGIDIRKMFLFSMIIGAAAAGLAGAIEVSGVHHRLIEGLHSNFATLGLIIGLMARGKNEAVPFVAFGISILEVGGSAMQRTIMVPVQIVLIAEALILIFILLADIIKRRQK